MVFKEKRRNMGKHRTNMQSTDGEKLEMEKHCRNEHVTQKQRRKVIGRELIYESI